MRLTAGEGRHAAIAGAKCGAASAANHVFRSSSPWAMVPLLDLLVPWSLGANDLTVTIVTTAIEVLYITHAVAQFARLPHWLSFARVTNSAHDWYAVLVGLVGLERLVVLLLPPMPAAG